MYQKYIKRLFDWIIAFIALVLLSPLFLIVIVAIKLESPGPAFFRQERVGKYKKRFYIYKFRTMFVSAPQDIPTHMLKNPETYITKIGGFLRRTSLDELPQLFNILKGDMAIVGPRPALWNQYDLIAEREKYNVNDVLPGLTGWAQINGRDELEITDKAKLDGEYIGKMGFIIDCRCIFSTFFKVLRQQGVVEGGTGYIYKSDRDGKI